jgi:hypothetical protein
MKRILLLLITATCSLSAFAQGEIPVDMYTGSPGVFISLGTVSDHDLSETIGLSYNVNGVNSSSPYGLGWNLSGVGGQVYRQVRGLPDDFAGQQTDTRKGWLYNSNWYNVTQFRNSSDLSTSTDEANAQTDLANYNYKNDTDPDIYSYSV